MSTLLFLELCLRARASKCPQTPSCETGCSFHAADQTLEPGHLRILCTCCEAAAPDRLMEVCFSRGSRTPEKSDSNVTMLRKRF